MTPTAALIRAIAIFLAVQLAQGLAVALAMLAFGLIVLRDPANALTMAWSVPLMALVWLTRLTLYPLGALAIAFLSRWRIAPLLHFGWSAAAGAFTLYRLDLNLTPQAEALAIATAFTASAAGYFTFRWLARRPR